MLRFVVICLWEGFAAAVILLGTAIASMKTWPSDTWQYVVLGVGALGAAVKAIDAYRRSPA